MYFAVISHNGDIMASKLFIEIAEDAAARIYPERHTAFRFDADKDKRNELRDAIAEALREIALEVARQ